MLYSQIPTVARATRGHTKWSAVGLRLVPTLASKNVEGRPPLGVFRDPPHNIS